MTIHSQLCLIQLYRPVIFELVRYMALWMKTCIDSFSHGQEFVVNSVDQNCELLSSSIWRLIWLNALVIPQDKDEEKTFYLWRKIAYSFLLLPFRQVLLLSPFSYEPAAHRNRV